MSIDTIAPPNQKIRAIPHEFTPKLVSMWREGYSFAYFKADALAGLTVAIVALPLSMAIAIASGAKPESGLFAAIIGGFLVSALGGSRFQIGGPAGAFIVVVATSIETFGYDGFLLATIMAGMVLVAAGYLRFGSYIRYIPHPVIVGFTAGIALIIFASQLRDLFGLRVEHEPAAFAAKIETLWAARASYHSVAIGLSLVSIGLIVGLRLWRPRFPGFLAAVVLGALASYALGLPVETIGTRFGGIPNGLNWPALPAISVSRIAELLPTALTFALLGGIESLLSAVVADGMTGRRHRSNCELVAQGIGNIGSALFGGLCVTGTIARTATNVRANAFGPISGILHAVFVLAFMVLAAPLASYIPLATLAALLAVVCWNMADKAEFLHILRHDRGEAIVLLATFGLTLFRDLMTGIATGVILGAILFMHKMATSVDVEGGLDQTGEEDEAALSASSEDIGVFRITGPFFFGASGAIGRVLGNVIAIPRALILDLSGVPFADATAAHTLEIFLKRARASHSKVYITQANAQVRSVLVRNGIDQPDVIYANSLAEARSEAAAGMAVEVPR